MVILTLFAIENGPFVLDLSIKVVLFRSDVFQGFSISLSFLKPENRQNHGEILWGCLAFLFAETIQRSKMGSPIFWKPPNMKGEYDGYKFCGDDDDDDDDSNVVTAWKNTLEF